MVTKLLPLSTMELLMTWKNVRMGSCSISTSWLLGMQSRIIGYYLTINQQFTSFVKRTFWLISGKPQICAGSVATQEWWSPNLLVILPDILPPFGTILGDSEHPILTSGISALSRTVWQPQGWCQFSNYEARWQDPWFSAISEWATLLWHITAQVPPPQHCWGEK